MPEKCQLVVDGGHLLQTLVWPTPSTYGDVCQSYISYTLEHYGAGSTVVFDGYSSSNSTKVVEQRRRAQRCTSNDVIFDDNTPTATSQAAFLANSHNKNRLIQAVREKMPMFGIRLSKLRQMQTRWSSQQLFMWQSLQRCQSLSLGLSGHASGSDNHIYTCVHVMPQQPDSTVQHPWNSTCHWRHR